MISGAQLRAARALLGLSAAELAESARVGHRTIQRFEADDDVPDGRTAILKQIMKTLEVKGIPHVIIIDPDGKVCWEGYPLLTGHKLTEETVEKLLAEKPEKPTPAKAE